MLQRLLPIGRDYRGQSKLSIPVRAFSKAGAILQTSFNTSSGVEVSHAEIHQVAMFLGRDENTGRDLFIDVRGMKRVEIEASGYWSVFYNSLPKASAGRPKIPVSEIPEEAIYRGRNLYGGPLFEQ